MSSTKNATAMDQNAGAEGCGDDSLPVVKPGSLIPTAEENALLEELEARIRLRPAPIAERMLADLDLAESRYVHPATDLNPYGHFQFLIRLQRELKRADKDGTPELFLVPKEKKEDDPESKDAPKSASVTYPQLIAAWVEEGQWITTQRGAQVLLETGGQVMHLSEALPAAEAVRQRIQIAIDGNGSEPEIVEALRLFVWDKRRTPVSRPAMQNHLGLATKSIRTLVAEVRKAKATPPGEVPEEARNLKGEALREAERNLSPWAPSVQRAVLGLERLLPLADQAIDDLASAVDGRTRPNTIKIWGRTVQVLVGANELMLNDFLRNAASTATPPRLRTLVNLLAPRRGPDDVPVAAPDPEAPPAEDETVIPFEESAESEAEEN